MPDSMGPEEFDPVPGPSEGDTSDVDTEGRRRKPRRPPSRLSDLLQGIAQDESRDRISLSHILDTVSVRAFGPLLLIFAIPNIIPAPPGTSAILGLPLLVLTFQMMLGYKPRFPAFIANRTIRRDDFARMIEAALPRLIKAERMLRPRLALLSSPVGERILGALCFVMATLLVLPIPLGNMAPSFAISLIGLGLIERDGYWIMGGMTVAAGAFFLVYGVIWTMALAGVQLLTSWF